MDLHREGKTDINLEWLVPLKIITRLGMFVLVWFGWWLCESFLVPCPTHPLYRKVHKMSVDLYWKKKKTGPFTRCWCVGLCHGRKRSVNLTIWVLSFIICSILWIRADKMRGRHEKLLSWVVRLDTFKIWPESQQHNIPAGEISETWHGECLVYPGAFIYSGPAAAAILEWSNAVSCLALLALSLSILSG